MITNEFPQHWEEVEEGLFVNRVFPIVADEQLSQEFVNKLKILERIARLPSGLPDTILKPEDHILYFVDTSGHSYIDAIIDYLVAGLEDPSYREICTLETGEEWNKETLEHLLFRRSPKIYADKLDIITWEVGYEPYISEERATKQEFIPNTMRNVFFNEMYSARQNFQPSPDVCVRIASEDSGHFLRSLTNPKDYLVYENSLVGDLTKTFQTPVLQMCVYKSDDISAVPNEVDIMNSISSDEILLRLLTAHNKFIAITKDETLLSGKEAKKYIIQKINIRNLPLSLYPTALKALISF